MKLKISSKIFFVNHILWLYEKIFGLKYLVLLFGLKSRRLDVRHPVNVSNKNDSKNETKFSDCNVQVLNIWFHGFGKTRLLLIKIYYIPL